MINQLSRATFRKFPLILCLMLPAAPGEAATLRPETLKAWMSYVEKTERRISSELTSNKGFLALDFQDPKQAAQERKRILSGETFIKEISDGNRIPDGIIHHWRGAVYIPEVALDSVLSRVADPGPEDTQQEDVLESRVLEKAPGKLRLFLKLQRTQIVAVTYNTEHLVRYRRISPTRASSSSVATKIAEIEHVGNKEREKPASQDSGYLWRMNSYWRYEQVSGGVIVECESMTLSRSIPALLEYMVRPLVQRVARESMRRTLESMRTRLVRAGPRPSVTVGVPVQGGSGRSGFDK